MHAVIVGAGEPGWYLTERLGTERHDGDVLGRGGQLVGTAPMGAVARHRHAPVRRLHFGIGIGVADHRNLGEVTAAIAESLAAVAGVHVGPGPQAAIHPDGELTSAGGLRGETRHPEGGA